MPLSKKKGKVEETKMKKGKKIVIISLVLSILSMSLIACQSSSKSKNENQSMSSKQQSEIVEETTKEAKAEESSNAETSDQEITIGILQFAQHSSLDNCREGFLQGLADQGFVEGENLIIDYQNSGADMALAAQIAENFVNKKYDMIMAIATPAAMHAYNAALDSDIPVVYTAISDPIISGLANEDGSSSGNITGTSDALPVEAQLKMIREIMPEAKTIGIMYTTSEANSESTIQIYEELAPKYDFELETIGIQTSADIPLAADNILTKVDCLCNLTDNTVVNSLPTIIDKAFAKNIPIFGSEVEQVSIGCLASEGIDYIALGQETGAMASLVLKGEAKAAEIPFRTIDESYLYLNTEAAEKLGIEIPEDMLNRAQEIFDTISHD